MAVELKWLLLRYVLKCAEKWNQTGNDISFNSHKLYFDVSGQWRVEEREVGKCWIGCAIVISIYTKHTHCMLSFAGPW